MSSNENHDADPDPDRDDFLKVRLTESEKNQLRDLADEAGISMSEFVRKSIFSDTVTIEKIPEINREVFQSASRVFANLNQIARRANEGKEVQIDRSGFENLLDHVIKLREELQS